MKNIFLILFLVISCKSFPQSNCTQHTVVPLKTYDIVDKECYYYKDTNNELQDYVGTWKGIWDNKIVYITFKKVINKYDSTLKYNSDIIIGKFKTLDNNGNILFDNTQVLDDDAKIEGGNFQKITNKYIMSYTDNDLCGLGGFIYISFANATKTQLNFGFNQQTQIIDTDCYFYSYPSSQYPKPLPNNIVLTKQ